MTKISYRTIDLVAPSRVFVGRGKATSVEAVNGVTITRVVDPPLDYYVVTGSTVVPGYEVDARAVIGGVRSPLPAVTGRGGKASDDGK